MVNVWTGLRLLINATKQRTLIQPYQTFAMDTRHAGKGRVGKVG